MAKAELMGLNELEKEIRNLSAREVRTGIKQGLAAARQVAVKAAKGAAPSSRVRSAIRGGTTALFKARSGGVTFQGDRGNLGFTAVGVPSLRRVAPGSNRRAWFVAYSLEIGNPGESARAVNRGRYKRSQAAQPFLAQAIESSSTQIVSAFGSKLKSALKL